jgi:type IV secretion system protein VirB2
MFKAESLKAVDMKKVVILLAVLAFVLVLIHNGVTFAESMGFSSAGSQMGDLGDKEFPWTKMLNTLAKQLTGPLPMTLGILGLAAAAIAMFTGNGGGGTQKFIMLIFAVSTCLFAPTFISWIKSSAGGATINDVVTVADTTVEVVKSGVMLP